MATEAEDYADAIYSHLAALAGRRLTWKQIQEAFGLSKAQFYEARKTGALFKRADRLIGAARQLEINPVELMIAVVPGLEPADAVAFVEKRRHEATEALGARAAADLAASLIRDLAADGADIDHIVALINEISGSPAEHEPLQEHRERS